MIKTNYGQIEQKVREAIKIADPKTIGFALKAFEEGLLTEKANNIVQEVKERCEREGSFQNLNAYSRHALIADFGTYTTIKTGNLDLDSKMRTILRKVLEDNLSVEIL